MRSIKIAILAILSVFAIAFSACSSSSDGPATSTSSGRAVFSISDKAADMGAVTSINVTVDSLSVHSKGGAWISLSNSAQTFDLLDLRAKGTAKLLAEANIQPGSYDQLEISVSKVVVVDASGEHDAKLPSNKLRINGSLEVKADATAAANFDFIADQSLHMTGDGEYILAPVIHLEAKQDASAKINSNKEVDVSGGKTTDDVRVGTDIEGSVDIGLRITSDAELHINSSGKIVQTRGEAVIRGTVKSVDEANGTITISTPSGNEISVQVTNNSTLKLTGSEVKIAALSGNLGAEVIVQFNAETKAVTDLSAKADAKAKADLGSKLDLSGTIKSVDTAKGTITITTGSGADVVLKADSNAELKIGGSTVKIADLGSKIGAEVESQYDGDGKSVGSLTVKTEANASSAGKIKSVDIADGKITITVNGSDTTFIIASDSMLKVNGALVSLATLKTMVGADVKVIFTEQSKLLIELDAQANVGTQPQPTVQAQATAQATVRASGTLKAVDIINGSVTVATQAGGDIVLKVAPDMKVTVNGTVSTVASLAASIGSRINIEYDSKTMAASSITVLPQGAASSASGTLKSVDVLKGTVTITTQTGADLVLSITTQSKMSVNGTSAPATVLVTKIGSKATVEFDAEAKTVTSLKIE